MSYQKLTRDQHFLSPGPKRILSLDGGGLKGIVTLGFLARLEALLRARHGGDEDFRLCHYFDLIAGTSTGAIIAAALAKGMPVSEVVDHYMTLGSKVFESGFFRRGILRARYDDKKLKRLLKDVLGADTLLGDESLQTGVLLVTKRTDTGSIWPIGNNPRARYFEGDPDSGRVANRVFPLWQVVRASTAAPSYFDPESILITEGASRRKAVRGEFVDGGVSPFNNPALQALMYATLDGYRVNWPTGPDNIFLVSVGTGEAAPGHEPSKVAAKGALKSLLSLMDDCGTLVETILQWMSSGTKVRGIDRELGDLRDDLAGATPLLTYVRYNVSFEPSGIDGLRPLLSDDINDALTDDRIGTLSAMDKKDNLDIWRALGTAAAAQQVEEIDLPHRFDLPA